jgi:hypothetical protein
MGPGIARKPRESAALLLPTYPQIATGVLPKRNQSGWGTRRIDIAPKRRCCGASCNCPKQAERRIAASARGTLPVAATEHGAEVVGQPDDASS